MSEPLSIAMLATRGRAAARACRAPRRRALAARARGDTAVAGPLEHDAQADLDEWGLTRFERRVVAVIREHAVDVVHYHYAWPFAALVPRLRRRFGAASPLFVGTLHGTDVTRPPASRHSARCTRPTC